MATPPPPQYSCLENPINRSLVGYNPYGCREGDTAEATEHACTRAEPCFVKYQCLGLSEGSALYCALRAVSKVSSCH